METQPETAAKPKAQYTEGQIIGEIITLDGPKNRVWRGGQIVEEFKEADDPALYLEARNALQKDKYAGAFRTYLQIYYARQKAGLKVPVFLKELEEAGVTKGQIKGLIKFHILNSGFGRVQNDNGKPAEAMTILWLTPSGHMIVDSVESHLQQMAEAKKQAQVPVKAVPEAQAEVATENLGQ